MEHGALKTGMLLSRIGLVRVAATEMWVEIANNVGLSDGDVEKLDLNLIYHIGHQCHFYQK